MQEVYSSSLPGASEKSIKNREQRIKDQVKARRAATRPRTTRSGVPRSPLQGCPFLAQGKDLALDPRRMPTRATAQGASATTSSMHGNFTSNYPKIGVFLRHTKLLWDSGGCKRMRWFGSTRRPFRGMRPDRGLVRGRAPRP